MNLLFSKEKKEEPESFKIVLPHPPTFIYVNGILKKQNGKWKKTKVRKYLTANLWYGASGNADEVKIITQIKHKIKLFFLSKDLQIPVFTKFPLRITYTYYGPKGEFDLQNKLFFWAKLFEDFLQKQGKIPEDNVEHIQSERYEYVASKEPELVIEIEKIDERRTSQTSRL